MTPEGGQFDPRILIGEGSCGKVFECFDKKDGKKKVYVTNHSLLSNFKSCELLSMVPEIIYIMIFSIFHTCIQCRT